MWGLSETLRAAMTEAFHPDECEIFAHSDGEHIKIAFRTDSGESREVVLRRKALPSLLNQLSAQIAPGQAVRIDSHSLRPGTDFVLQGWECRLDAQGGARLVLYIDLPEQGRVVTVPLSLNAADVAQLIARLTGDP